MSANTYYHAPDGRGIPLPMPVPSTAKNGGIVKVGDLTVYLFSARATPESREKNKSLQGLPDGWASCSLLGCTHVLEADIPAGTTVGQKIWLANDGTLSTSGTDEHIGYAVPILRFYNGLALAVRGSIN